MKTGMIQIAKATSAEGDRYVRLYFKLDPTEPDFPFLISVTSAYDEPHYWDYPDIISAAKAFARLTQD